MKKSQSIKLMIAVTAFSLNTCQLDDHALGEKCDNLQIIYNGENECNANDPSECLIPGDWHIISDFEAAFNNHRCPIEYICVPDGQYGTCRKINTSPKCANDTKEDGTCLCPEKCVNGCNDDGTCKPLDGCKNGTNSNGTCRCPDKCKNGCDETGSVCICSANCVNGCNDDGACKPLDGCQNGANPDGTCKCPDKCQNGCDETGAVCTCPASCIDGCNDIGSQCTCKASCVDGTSCDTNTGKCTCVERCKFGCDANGSCAEACENFKCEGPNEQCQAIEKEDKYEAVCVDLCKNKECPNNTYCKDGNCIFWDENNNHLHDMYETAVKQGEDCRKYSDCDSMPNQGDGFCDSLIGYKCSTKCTDDSQCVDDQNYHYICRPDGRCAPNSFVTVWKIPSDNKQLRIPTSTAEACNFDIDWGDGSISKKCLKESKNNTIDCKELGINTSIDEGSLLHTYQESGFVTVNITGKYDGFGWPVEDEYYLDQDGEHIFSYRYENLDNSPTKLYEIKAYGPVGLGSYSFAFSKTNAISAISKVDIPDASQMQEVLFTFYRSAFNLPIENWDMSHVVDMRGMFKYANKFNQSLAHWDTSSVKWMGNKGDSLEIPNGVLSEGVFSYASAFNQPLENWDTSNVISLSYMFKNATTFNGDLNAWDTSKVMFMYGIFWEAHSFDQPLDHWNTSNVTDLRRAFNEAHSFNQSLNTWDTSNVTSMKDMFYNATKFNGAIGSWNTSKVENMSYMFFNAISFNQPINQWKVNSVTDMNGMFSGAITFNQSLDSWYPIKVKYMSNMFQNATSFNQPIFLYNNNTSEVTNMSDMFNGASSFNQSVNHFDVKNVTYMDNMFNGATAFNQPLNKWRTSNVKSMRSMFRNATAFNQPLNSWDTSNVKNMDNMFEGATTFNSALFYNLSSATSLNWMFQNATSFNQDLSSWQFAQKATVTNIFKNTKLSNESNDIYCKIFNAWKTHIFATTCTSLGKQDCSCE